MPVFLHLIIQGRIVSVDSAISEIVIAGAGNGGVLWKKGKKF